jgi:hypothetical protein
MSFTRVVQLASPRREQNGGTPTWVVVNDYRVIKLSDDKTTLDLADGWTGIDLSRNNDLDAAIRRCGVVPNPDNVKPWESKEVVDGQAREDVRPVLYKFHGSYNVDNSLLVTSDDYDDFDMTRVPYHIQQRVKNGALLFLGYSFLDPELRHLGRTLLRGSVTPGEKKTPKRFAVHIPLPPHPLHWVETTLLSDMETAWSVAPYTTRFLDKFSCAELLRSTAELVARVP